MRRLALLHHGGAMRLMRLTRSLLVTVAILCASPVLAGDLSTEDKKLLERFLETTLYDPPPEAERVVASVALRTCWGNVDEVERDLWRLPAKGERPERLLRADGFVETAVVTSVAPVRVDLAGQARARLKPMTKDEEQWAPFTGMSRTAGHGPQTDHDLALAAWLHKRGEDSLAADLLARSRERETKDEAGHVLSLEKVLRADLAWFAFSDLVNAFIVCADEEALVAGRHLLDRYPEEAKAYDQARAVVADLERRKGEGRSGVKGPEKPPEGFDKKTKEEQVAWLVRALEDVDARQWGQPGGVSLTTDWRIEGLIELGEVAVPALIDVVEKDERLMRSMHFWRDFARDRTVLSVREGALVAVMSILRWSVFKPSATGSNFTGSGAERMQAVARELRAYWKENGAIPIEKRMRSMLLKADATQEQLREAAENLATLDHKRRIGTTVWSGSMTATRAPAPNPALALADPTAAEAILAAMDRDVATGDPRWKDDAGMWLFTLRKIETHYIECLIELGDKRIAPEARRRCDSATTMRMRRQWALVAHKLGDPEPMAAFLKDVAAAKLELPPIVDPGPRGHMNEEPGVVELSQLGSTAVRVNTKEADDAMFALASRTHPWHDTIENLLHHRVTRGDSRGLFAHQYHLLLLADDLDDTKETGTTYKLKGDEVWSDSDGHEGRLSFDLAPFKGTKLVAEAKERVCDDAGYRIARKLLGVPPYHALLEDRDARRAEHKSLIARYGRGVRRATKADFEALGVEPTWESPDYIIGVQPLGRPATEKDLAEGRAIFHFGGESKVAAVKLPAKGKLKLEDGRVVGVIVVQAEQKGADVRYGVIAADRVVSVPGEKVEGLETMPVEGR